MKRSFSCMSVALHVIFVRSAKLRAASSPWPLLLTRVATGGLASLVAHGFACLRFLFYRRARTYSGA